MTATSAPHRNQRPHRPDPTRTGAVWVTGTGAFLLLAAASVFTAVRWGQIPSEAKLAALGLATGGFLLAGRRLVATLPATAGALFHLGAFLVPLDVAAIGVNVRADWSTLLLAEGIAATITFWWAARTEDSVVLRWSAGAATVVLAAGIGAVTALPPALLLAGAAAAAFVARRHAIALGWAATAGLAPVFALAEGLVTTGTGTIERLGLFPGSHPLAAGVAAIGAATVFAGIGRRQDDTNLVLVGAVVAATGVAAAWAGAEPAAGPTVVGLAATFVAVQLAALAVREDPFWKQPASLIATITERLAIVGYVPLLAFAVAAVGLDWMEPGYALASLLLAAGWAVAEQRRGDAGLPLPTTAVAAGALAAVAFATTSPIALGAAASAIAILAVLADRRDGALVAVVTAIGAPLVVWGSHPAAVAVLGLVGGATLGELAVRRSWRAAVDPVAARAVEESAWLLSLTAVVPPALAMWAIATQTQHVAATLVAGAAAITLLAAWIDRGQTTGDLPLGTVARLGSVAVLSGVGHLPVEQIAIVAVAVASLSLLDAVRLRAPMVALGASLAVPVAIGAFVHWTGLSTPSTGVALTVAAVVLAGLASLGDRAWVVPAAAGSALAVLGGLLLASGETVAFANALMITGGLGVAGSLLLGRFDALYASGSVATLGVWLQLGAASISAPEAYLLPVVALLLLAGTRSRSAGTSSWIAYGPAIALLGGTALVERIDGGSGWHALVAGTVGVAAVAAGGDRRLAGPLVLGTALLVGLVGYESLAITAGLPTWLWLALGGATLLGAGVAMERHDVGPLETGRRLVDVVAERFT